LEIGEDIQKVRGENVLDEFIEIAKADLDKMGS